MTQTYVLYHAGCADGFGAAYAVWRKLGYNPSYLPVSYGQPLPAIDDNARVIIVDFSYDRQTLLDLDARVADLVVLDHHKTAREELDGLSFAHFSEDESGAVMAWKYFHPAEPVPAILCYIQDRDLWTWEKPFSRAVNAAIAAEPFSFAFFDTHAENVGKLIEVGSAILRYQRTLVERICDNAFFAQVDGLHVPVVNAPILQSEIGEELLLRFPNEPFVGIYTDLSDRRKWSLRSRGEIDVSCVAERLGGGGHAGAAGFDERYAGEKVAV